jgi:hypothetical protein
VPLPEGHWRSVAEPQRLRARERWLIGAVLCAVAALLVAFAVSLGSDGGGAGRGCIDVTAQGPVGGTELRRCGSEARALCAGAAAGTGGSVAGGGALAAALPAACRRAGLPVGR